MARIPDQEVERLKAEVDLAALVAAKGIELRRSGRDLVGLCPFHDDRDPSLIVTPDKNLWHCLGACRRGGSVIDWVMAAEGVSFRHAVEILRADEVKINATKPVGHSSVRKLPTPLRIDAADHELLAEVVDYYRDALKESSEALAYLHRRGIGDDELVENFSLGFANRTLGYRLPDKNRSLGATVRGRLARLGVYRSSGHEHFNGSIVIPVTDARGRVVELYGRKITKALRKGTPDHLYLPGPHQGVFNLDALKTSDEIILCESLIDALSFWAAGFRHVTASYGTNGFTQDHHDAFARHAIKRVLIAYDPDDAGDSAASELAAELTATGIECFRVVFPKGKDANDIVRDANSPRDALGKLVRSATWLGKGRAPLLRFTPPVAQTEPDAPVASSLAAEPAAPIESPVPADQSLELDVQADGDEATITIHDRRWRVRGLSKVTSFDLLRLNVLVALTDDAGETTDVHVDTFDLYSARARQAFVTTASKELRAKPEVIAKDLGQVLLACERLAEDVVRKAQTPRGEAVVLNEAERAAALELLTDPDLLERITQDFERAGVVGETDNKLVAYLAAVSRKLDEPLAVVVQSSSAAGKSSLMEAALAFVPTEERVKFSAMTGQSLYYMGDQDLKHKVLAIAEEGGAERASYPLKLLQSEGELSIASTGKDPTTGRLTTHEYRVTGPVAIMLTTTAIDIDEELLSRCLVLTVDEDRDQTRAIHHAQRSSQTLEGVLSRRDRGAITKLHQDAQRLIEPVVVVNPFAPQLTFADARTRNRRDHMRYLTLIRTIALVHQHQREHKTIEHAGETVTYIEATLDDVVVANRLAHVVLGTSLDDLAPQTRRLLHLIEAFVADSGVARSELRFTRKDIRAATGWSDFQVRKHLERLVELEHVLCHRGARGMSFVYELLYDGAGKDGERFVAGLIDVDALDSRGYDSDPEPRSTGFAQGSTTFEPPPSPQQAPNEPGSRDPESVSLAAVSLPECDDDEKTRLWGASSPSYVGEGA